MFLEGCDAPDKKEEADKFAADVLIPPVRLEAFVALHDLSKTSIVRFAKSIGIAPGIVVGRPQHGGLLSPSPCNDFLPIAGKIESGTYLLCYGACGTGGMLTVAEETLKGLAEERVVVRHGPSDNPEGKP